MLSKKITATLLILALIGVSAMALGCTSPSPSPTPTAGASPSPTTAPLSGNIKISGSTTIYPVAQLLAKSFGDKYPNVKVDVQAGGSGKGMTDVGTGMVDIGMASEDVPADVLSKYPNITTFKVGESAVVVIVNSADGVNVTDVNDLKLLYDNVTGNKPAAFADYTVYTRAEKSGTADTFSAYVFNNKSAIYNSVETTGVNGNQAMVDAVAAKPKSIGFVDFGFAKNNTKVKITGIKDKDGTYSAPTADGLIKVFKGTDKTLYPVGLTRPLNFLTNGQPTPLVKSFIDYTKSQDGKYAFDQNGFFSVLDIT